MARTNVEYADWQITVYPTCPYNCRYCWANTPLFRYRTQNPRPLEEARKLLNAKKSLRVVVSFTSDPYQPRELNEKLTQLVLSILLGSRHEVYVLTKNPKLAVERDLELFRVGGFWLGSTITALWHIGAEPKAPGNDERVYWLRQAHEKGVKTWVSIEPWIPYVTAPIEIIKETQNYVDFYVIGRLNYAGKFGFKIPKDYYKSHLPAVISFLERLGKPFHIKKELKKEVYGEDDC